MLYEDLLYVLGSSQQRYVKRHLVSRKELMLLLYIDMSTSRFFVVLCGRFRGEDSDGISEHFVGNPFGWPPALTPDHQAR